MIGRNRFPNDLFSNLIQIYFSHYLTVNRLLFSPKTEKTTDGWVRLRLASCGADHSLHIINICLRQ